MADKTKGAIYTVEVLCDKDQQVEMTGPIAEMMEFISLHMKKLDQYDLAQVRVFEEVLACPISMYEIVMQDFEDDVALNKNYGVMDMYDKGMRDAMTIVYDATMGTLHDEIEDSLKNIVASVQARQTTKEKAMIILGDQTQKPNEDTTEEPNEPPMALEELNKWYNSSTKFLVQGWHTMTHERKYEIYQDYLAQCNEDISDEELYSEYQQEATA